jgi:hypothetical protein
MAPIVLKVKKLRVNPIQKSMSQWKSIVFEPNLAIKEKLRILSSKELIKNYRFLLIKREEVLTRRAEKKIDIINHIQYRDPTGRTLGCGCIYCQLRHAEWKKQQELNNIKQVINNLRRTSKIVSGLRISKNQYNYNNRTEYELGRVKINSLPFGKFCLKDPGFFDKHISKFESKAKIAEENYIKLKYGRQAIAKLTLIPG